MPEYFDKLPPTDLEARAGTNPFPRHYHYFPIFC